MSRSGIHTVAPAPALPAGEGADLIRLAKIERLRRDAAEDLLTCISCVEPSYEISWHHEVLAAHLEAVERGEINRLMVFMPPRHSKSKTVSQHFPAWALGRHPEWEIILCSYALDLAVTFGRNTRNITQDAKYQEIFPELRLAEDSAAASHWQTHKQGGFLAAGVRGPITGHGARILLIDDPIKNQEEADSPYVREMIYDWYRNTAYTRLTPDGAIVLIMTRWHDDDLAGKLLRAARDPEADQWSVLSLAAEAEAGEPFRPCGDPLWPSQYSLEKLRQIRVNIGSRAYAAQYQQRPVLDGGNIIKLNWFKRYSMLPNETPRRIIQSIDSAFKTGQDNDPTCIGTWHEYSTGYYLVNVLLRKMEFPDLKRVSKDVFERDHPIAVIVEDKASGQSLIQEMRRDTKIPVIAIKVDQDKMARVNSVSPLFESGRVFIPEQAEWVVDYMDELVRFPTAPHDDQMDMTTQALTYLTKPAGSPSIRRL